MSKIMQWIIVMWVAGVLSGCAVYPMTYQGSYGGGYYYPPPAVRVYAPDPFAVGIVTGVILGGALHRGHQHHHFHRR